MDARDVSGAAAATSFASFQATSALGPAIPQVSLSLSYWEQNAKVDPADVPSPQPVGHAGGEPVPRRSTNLSPINSASVRRASTSDLVPPGPDRIPSGLQPASPPKGRACGSNGAKSRGSCVRISTTLYTVVGGTFLVLALMWLSQYEKRFRPKGRFEDIWVPGYRSINYHLEVEETWESLDGEAQRFQAINRRVELNVSDEIHPTEHLGGLLEQVVGKYGILSMIDGGCGPLSWQPDFLLIMAHFRIPFKYLGVDSSIDIALTNTWEVKFNRAVHGNMCTFEALDLRTTPLPDGYEMLMLMDTLENLPLPDVLDILKNIQHSSVDFLLISRHAAPSLPGGFTGLSDLPFTAPSVPEALKMGLQSPLEIVQGLRDRRGRPMEALLYPMSVVRAMDFEQFRPFSVSQRPQARDLSPAVPSVPYSVGLAPPASPLK